MAGNYGDEANRVFDSIVSGRRSIRKFKDAVPPKENIEQIIKAGIFAPYAGSTGRTLAETRRFVVLQKNTETMKKANEIMYTQLKKAAKIFIFLTKIIPYLRKKGTTFAKVLENAALNGIPAFKTAPYYIIVAERKGIPPVEHQSLAFVLENMWLKTTALGMGFQLITATQQMSKNKAFMDLLGIPFGEYAIDGCVVGYPDQVPAPRPEIAVSDLTKWL